jgi:hypothetical protein
VAAGAERSIGRLLHLALVVFALALLASRAYAQQSNEELAKKLSNPIASLISVPLQFNADFKIGPNDGERYYLNFQPVIPISLGPAWNVISRTILPINYQHDIYPFDEHQLGLGDTTQSFFFSPKAASEIGGLIWGVGPAFLVPTATDDLLGSEKFGLGPTFVVLKQTGPWTIGLLANQIWSVAGADSRDAISSAFLQPFVSYTTAEAMTFTLNTESTYNWKSEDWTVPLNLQVSQVLKIGDQRVSIGGGIRYYADAPQGGPEGFGARLIVTFLFPE